MKIIGTDLVTFNGGALQELFDEGIKQVAENLNNPNTEKGKAAKISLDISFTPDEEDSENVKITIK